MAVDLSQAFSLYAEFVLFVQGALPLALQYQPFRLMVKVLCKRQAESLKEHRLGQRPNKKCDRESSP